MKNLLFTAIAILGFSVISFGQSPTATATASASIVAAISLDKNTDMLFGNIVNISGDVVTLNTNSSRSAAGTGVTLPASTLGTVSAAKFTVSGGINSTFGFTAPPTSILLTKSAGVTMTVNNFKMVAVSGTLGTLTSATQEVLVGGDLIVPALAEAGTYTGSYTLTVSYN